jgi:hypothetical protein
MKVPWKIICTLTLVLAPYHLAIESAAARAAQNPRTPVNVQQLQRSLLTVYLVRARIDDLLGLLQTTKWKMTDAERAALLQRTAAVDHELQTLETWRYQFFYHPQDAPSGEKTVETMHDLIPQLQQISKEAEHYQDTGTASQVLQTAVELSKLRNEIGNYLQAAFPGSSLPSQASSPAAAAAKPQPSVNPASTTTSALNVPTQSRRRATTTEAKSGPLGPAPPALSPRLPRTATTETESGPVVAPAVHIQPQQVQKMLLNVYMVSARIKDLLSMVQPEEWKMAGGERTAFEQQLQSVQAGFANLEQWRYQFASHVQSTDSADKTAGAIATLLPQIQQIGAIVGQFEGPKAAAQFQQPVGDLASLKTSIGSYADSLRAAYKTELAAAPAGSPSLQTERIAVSAPPPPVQYLPGLIPPLSSSQVKAVLYKMYVSVYRVRDLLSQEKPDQWKASLADRNAAEQARTSILSEANELEKWRGLFSEYPENMYYAFQLYRSVAQLVQPLQAFSLGVDRYEDANLASDYSRRAGDLQARLGDLIPYITFFLQHESQNINLYQSDLASCQNRLSYAMHGFNHIAIPMRNILPDFKGRRVTRAKAKVAGHHRSRHATRKKRNP